TPTDDGVGAPTSALDLTHVIMMMVNRGSPLAGGSLSRDETGGQQNNNLSQLVMDINIHLQDHHTKSEGECKLVMGRIKDKIQGLMDVYLCPKADPARVSEMCLFLVMLVGQEFLECEHTSRIFEEGDIRAILKPVLKICALLPLPKFAHLQHRLVEHATLLASQWLPRHAAAMISFFEELVDLLSDLDVLWDAAKERGADAVLIPGTMAVAFTRLAEELGQEPLELPLSSAQHLALCQTATVAIAAQVSTAIPAVASGTLAFTNLWTLLCKQLGGGLTPSNENIHKASLEAVLVLLDQEEPPQGIAPRLAFHCLTLADQVLEPSCWTAKKAWGEEGERDEESRFQDETTVKELLSRCIQSLFTTNGQGMSCQLELRECLFTALSSSLGVVARWWTSRGTPICTIPLAVNKGGGGSTDGGGAPVTASGGNAEEAEVGLVRAIVGAFTSVVESCNTPYSAWETSAAPIMAAVPAAAGEEEARREVVLEEGGQEMTPFPAREGDTVLLVPRGLAGVVSSLAPVACVQLELVRCLHAVLQGFQDIPRRVLSEGDLGIGERE
ncbi:unnamed protein product, partial [Discosporangium mesarthrocarpum]